MKGLYPRLALSGIKKNKDIYFPYMLTCIGMVMMCYIIWFLSESGVVADGVGGVYVQMILGFGRGVMGLFSLIFLFYTHSFLIKGRKREFGLYNILGLNKRNIAVIMLWETLIIYVVTLAAGLGTGILFSKLAELAAGRLINIDVSNEFIVSAGAVKGCLSFFAVIYILIFLSSLRQIGKADPAELLSSENTGEIPPKSNILTAVPGVLLLGGAYAIAIIVDNPVAAMLLLVIAVIMVIIATYILFTAGSSALCAALKKNKKYYYTTKHFISVSQMNFRMKRNGAGLASICILSTMVLVTVSATTCLYIGEDRSVNARLPHDMDISVAAGDNIDGYLEAVDNVITEELDSHSLKAENICGYYYYKRSGIYSDGVIEYNDSFSEMSNAMYIDYVMLTEQEYNRITGKNISLEEDEILFGDTENTVTVTNSLSFAGKDSRLTFRTAGSADGFDRVSGSVAIGVTSTFIIVLQNENIINDIIWQSYESQGVYTSSITAEYPQRMYGLSFDIDSDNRVQLDIYNGIRDKILADMEADENYPSLHITSKAEMKSAFFTMSGSLFFLGIILGTVFIFAAALIMYYKQSSEGYEDKKRYDILQKVGMTDREIKSTINSQVLTVFFLPLIAAGIHLCFAFPILSQCLKIFMLTDTVLFAKVSLCCFGAFAVFYIAVYLITSKKYYRIVK